MPPGAKEFKANAQVGRRQVRLRPVGPFDQTEAVSSIGSKVFIQPRIEKFFRKVESIKIKVI